MQTLKLKFNFALTAEQVVAPGESDRPRRSIGFDETTPFETKLKYLDKVGVSAFWLYGFRSAEGTMRDIGLLSEAKRKLERLGKEAYIVCEPVGHPDPNQKVLPGKGWRYHQLRRDAGLRVRGYRGALGAGSGRRDKGLPGCRVQEGVLR